VSIFWTPDSSLHRRPGRPAGCVSSQGASRPDRFGSAGRGRSAGWRYLVYLVCLVYLL